MKKIIVQAAAASLAAALAFNGPATAQTLETTDNEVSSGQQMLDIRAAQRLERFEELQAKLAEISAQEQQQRAAIAERLANSNPGMSEAELTARTEEVFLEEQQAMLAQRESRITDFDLGENYKSLPAEFEQAVRGCTVDGYVYRLPYNFTFNEDDIVRLLDRLAKPDPEALLGVRGTENFPQTLKNMFAEVNATIETHVGPLIDEANSSDIDDPNIFRPVITLAMENIAGRTKKKYDVSLEISTGDPVRQAGRCAITAPQPAEP